MRLPDDFYISTFFILFIYFFRYPSRLRYMHDIINIFLCLEVYLYIGCRL